MKWHSGDEKPKKSGWYIRDYRGCSQKPDEKRFSVDYYNVDDKPQGFWYVTFFKLGEWQLDDAAFPNLPWAKIKDYPE